MSPFGILFNLRMTEVEVTTGAIRRVKLQNEDILVSEDGPQASFIVTEDYLIDGEAIIDVHDVLPVIPVTTPRPVNE